MTVNVPHAKGLTKRQGLSAANSEQNRERTVPEQLLRNQFKPGQSGNPSGRPKKKPITELYERILSDPKNVAMVRRAIVKALSSGQVVMVQQLKEMADRIEGTMRQQVDHSGRVTLESLILESYKPKDEQNQS